VEQLPNVSRSLKKESCKFTLNKLQHAAFRKIGSALLAHWKKADDLNYEATVVQAVYGLISFYITLVVKAAPGRLVSLVLCRSYALGGDGGGCLLKTALTGKAATLISGRTLASLLLGLKGSKSMSTRGCDIIVIDDVSMMHKSQLAELDNRLRVATRNASVPFGGIHIILAGDFLQLPPVGADPLYITPWSRIFLMPPR